MNEAKLLAFINDKLNMELTSTNKDQYCPYDAYNDKYTVELKCRRKHYNTQMIEMYKIKKLREGKELLYIVSTPEGIFGFNVSKLLDADYDFKWETKKLPATTDFNRREWIDKVVGYIDVNKAVWRDNYDSTD